MNVCQPRRAGVFFTLFLVSALGISERATAGPVRLLSSSNRHVALRLYGRS
jgi:hypothetical protein